MTSGKVWEISRKILESQREIFFFVVDLQEIAILAGEEGRYEVDKILENEKREEEYLIKWTNYNYYKSRWEKEEHNIKWQQTDQKTRKNRRSAYKRPLKIKQQILCAIETNSSTKLFQNLKMAT